MTITETTQETEAHQAETHGHELGCFQWLAEEIIEDLAERGIAYETGNFDEDIAGVTILDRIIQALESGKAKCRCEWLTAEGEE